MKLGIGISSLARIVAIAFTASSWACAPSPSSCEARFADDPPPSEPLEAKLSPCARAGKNLRIVCPTRVKKIEQLAKTTYETWCQYEVDHGTPLCPERLTKVKNCTEAEHVCR